MRIPYLGLLALGGRAEENRILEIEKSVLEQLEQEIDQSSKEKLHPCPDGSFRCRDGSCIDGKARCDGISDCTDESDESDCANEKRIQSSDSSQHQQRVRRQFPDFSPFQTTAFPDFLMETSADNFEEFFLPDQTTEGFFLNNLGTTAMPDFGAFGQFTTEPLLDNLATTDAQFFDMATTDSGAMLGEFLQDTTQVPFVDTTQAIDAFFAQTTEGFDFPATTEEANIFFPATTAASQPFAQETTEQIDFGMFATTEGSFPDLQTTASPSLFTTQSGNLAYGTTESPQMFRETTYIDTFFPETTAPFELAPETTEPTFVGQATSEAMLPLVPEATTMPNFVPETTDSMILPTTMPDLELPFPEATTGMDFGGFETTQSAQFPTFAPTTMGFPEDVFPTFSPTTFPALDFTTAPLTTFAPIEMTTASSGENPLIFICADGKGTMTTDFVCDRFNDCDDASDEANCGYTPEPTTQTAVFTQPVEPETTSYTTNFVETQPPTTLPSNMDDREQVAKFIDHFIKWRTTIFDKWLSVMKTYQERSNIKVESQSFCKQYGRANSNECKTMGRTCKDDLTGCQYCYCEISRSELDTEFIKKEWEMDVQFWQDVLQNQWTSVWEQYSDNDEYDYL